MKFRSRASSLCGAGCGCRQLELQNCGCILSCDGRLFPFSSAAQQPPAAPTMRMGLTPTSLDQQQRASQPVCSGSPAVSQGCSTA
jgi:hypothetical protein